MSWEVNQSVLFTREGSGFSKEGSASDYRVIRLALLAVPLRQVRPLPCSRCFAGAGTMDQWGNRHTPGENDCVNAKEGGVNLVRAYHANIDAIINMINLASQVGI
jgi:hypothetical protein